MSAGCHQLSSDAEPLPFHPSIGRPQVQLRLVCCIRREDQDERSQAREVCQAGWFDLRVLIWRCAHHDHHHQKELNASAACPFSAGAGNIMSPLPVSLFKALRHCTGRLGDSAPSPGRIQTTIRILRPRPCTPPLPATLIHQRTRSSCSKEPVPLRKRVPTIGRRALYHMDLCKPHVSNLSSPEIC
jgi:hypothetical protein